MALLTALSTEEAVALGRLYGLEVERCEALSQGSVNSNFALWTRDGTRYFARLYEEQVRAGAEIELGLLRTLAQAAVPVVNPLNASSGELCVEHGGKPFAVFPWLDGDWLCLQRVTPFHCHA